VVNIVCAGGCENKIVIRVFIISQRATASIQAIILPNFHPLAYPPVLIQCPLPYKTLRSVTALQQTIPSTNWTSSVAEPMSVQNEEKQSQVQYS
jgi:hypothetical protein